MLSEQSESKHPPAEPPCYVYLIECQGGYLYTGISTNPQRRFQQHQAGGSRFTKARPALRLLWI